MLLTRSIFNQFQHHYSLGNYAEKSTNLNDVDESLVGQLNEVEKYLLKSQDLMKVRGKVSKTILARLFFRKP